MKSESNVLLSMRPGPMLDVIEPAVGERALLGFVVGGERYALPLSSIREILRPLPVTEVPRAPRDVMGIVSVRGTVTTLIDLRARLKVEVAPPGPSNRILLVDQGHEVLGLYVDSVLQVYRLREDEVELAPAIGGDAPAHIVGIGRPGAARAASEHEADEVAQTEGREKRARSAADPQDELLVLLDPMALLKE